MGSNPKGEIAMTDPKGKPTPGPWRVSIVGDNIWVCGPNKDEVIAFIGGKDTIFTKHPNTPHKANARLIAQACLIPEIVEALETIFPDWVKNSQEENGTMFGWREKAKKEIETLLAKLREAQK